ncbi:Bacterial extracellular solute-binding protein, family 3 [Pseudodesulfovibrio hydrargyri]|uniref:Bacterial extracellular solute-binding protein, family 3 n=1 Tax=Pseudodesulfovibrio hydrargyri TaxID=2125990 RepID=A0A1J5MUQ7_9BACT|nr:transporter substrate-binding domain-containing protein [Pseudodesulfovibrio hydrargyri]OIQ50342.1 Bacterial extracellular solute-binding protein, family 3 [Pseudodesulfovibrio hydrargyri]
MRTILKILPLSLCLLLIESAGMAGVVPTAAEERSMVMFIAYADVPPYYIDDSEGRGNGILMDVLRAVTGPLNCTVTSMRLPDKRGWEMLEHGGVDVYASAREWIGNPDRFLWTDPFMPNDDVLIYRAGSPQIYSGPESLYGKTVACIKGFVYPTLEGHFGPGRIMRIDATSPEAMLELLVRGRADAVLVNHTEIRWIFRTSREHEPHRFRIDAQPVDRALIRFLFPRGRGWEPMVGQFNRRLHAMRKDGSLNAILDRYK